MLPKKFLKRVYEHPGRNSSHTTALNRTWSSGPTSNLARAFLQLPGVDVVHLEHGAHSEDGSVTTPRFLVELDDSNMAVLLGLTIERAGIIPETRLEWIIRHIGTTELLSGEQHPWIKDVDLSGHSEDDLWWIYPVGKPEMFAEQGEWLRKAHADCSGDVFLAYVEGVLESRLAEMGYFKNRKPHE